MKRTYAMRRLVARELVERVGRLAAGPAVMGIDVAKREVVLVVRGPDGAWAGPYRAVNPDGVGAVVEAAVGIGGGRALRVAMESSGTYGDVLRQALSDAKVELHRVEAKRSHDYAEVFDGVPSQHDGKDAAVVAELCAIGKSVVWAYAPPDETEGRMRALVDWIDGQDRARRLWVGRVEALLARHWPEATGVLALKSGTLMRALVKYGGPGPLAADPGALKTLTRWGGSLLAPAKAEALLASAQTTLGVRQNGADRDRLARCARSAWEASLEVQRSKKQLKDLAKGNAVIQKQAAAVGVVTACVLWCRLGDPRDYPAAQAYRKAMGLNLTERSSGQFRGAAHISKRGDRLVRRWLHLGALRLVRQHPEVRQWYQAKRGRDGGRHLGALTGVVRRLAIALHVVGTGPEPFDAKRLFAGTAGVGVGVGATVGVCADAAGGPQSATAAMTGATSQAAACAAGGA